MNAAFDAMFVLHSITGFQLLVIVACVAFIAALAGLIWGSRMRDDLDELYAGRSLADDARHGRIERRLQPRGLQPIISQPTPERRDQASVPPRASTPRCRP